MRFSNRASDAMLAALAERMSGGTLRFYDLTPPGTPDGKTSAHKLAQLAFASVELDAGQIRATMGEALATRSGEVGWAQCVDAEGNVLFDCAVGDDHSGSPIEMNTRDLKKGGPVKLRSFSLGY